LPKRNDLADTRHDACTVIEHVVGKKAQHPKSLGLEQEVFATVTPVRRLVRKVMVSIDLDGQLEQD
jgi:hypothetical protein